MALLVAVCVAAVGIAVLFPPSPQKESTVTAPTAKKAAPAKKPRKHKAVWTERCVPEQHFCVQFPHIVGKRVYHVEHYDSATAVGGESVAYVSNVFRYPKTHEVCVGVNCWEKAINHGYIVSVFRSKYQDPWTALTAINGGTFPGIRGTKSGHLAAHFHPGLYGGTELTVYAHGMVYYVFTTGEDHKGNLVGAPNVERFLGSFRIT